MKPGAETAAGCGPNSENNSEYQPAAPLFFWPRCRPHPRDSAEQDAVDR